MSVQDQDHIHQLMHDLRKTESGEKIQLPQVIVVGDQSSGKSSVLEAVSGLRFPRSDGLCTRFSTTVEMAYSEETVLVPTIIPSPTRSEEEKQRLRAWGATQHRTSLSEFEDIVTAAGQVMGGDSHSGILRDRLTVTVRSPTSSFFTFVDLPGLIASTSDEQDESDIQHSESLAATWMANKRSVILAVVAGNNDLENQKVLRMAKIHDPKGVRTLGVITKPDLAHNGQRNKACDLVTGRNESHKFDLGWHVVRNADTERDGVVNLQQSLVQEETFWESSVFKTVRPEARGAQSLRIRIDLVYTSAVKAHLPAVRDDINRRIGQCELELKELQKSVSALDNPAAVFYEGVRNIVDDVQVQLQARRSKFRSALEKATAELEALLRLKGNFYNVDSTLSEHDWTKHKDSTGNLRDWPEPRPVKELLDAAADIVEKEAADTGQVSDQMIEQLFSLQTKPWHAIVQTSLDNIDNLIEITVDSSQPKDMAPEIIEQTAQLISENRPSFNNFIASCVFDLTAVPSTNSTEYNTALRLGWQVGVRRILRESITTTFNTGTRLKQETVLQCAEQGQPDPIKVVAAQVVAVMQSMYHRKMEDIIHDLSVEKLSRHIEQYLNELPENLMTPKIESRCKAIFGEQQLDDQELERVAELETDLEIYREYVRSIDHIMHSKGGVISIS